VRIFLNTNVLASSIATRGLCSELLESVLHEHELLTCQAVLRELERVLADRFRLPQPVVDGFVGLLQTEGAVIASNERPVVPVKDTDDIAILGCAIAGKAGVFVTGDKELLDLGEIAGVPVISPRDLWLQLAGLEKPRKPK